MDMTPSPAISVLGDFIADGIEKDIAPAVTPDQIHGPLSLDFYTFLAGSRETRLFLADSHRSTTKKNSNLLSEFQLQQQQMRTDTWNIVNFSSKVARRNAGSAHKVA